MLWNYFAYHWLSPLSAFFVQNFKRSSSVCLNSVYTTCSVQTVVVTLWKMTWKYAMSWLRLHTLQKTFEICWDICCWLESKVSDLFSLVEKHAHFFVSAQRPVRVFLPVEVSGKFRGYSCHACTAVVLSASTLPLAEQQGWNTLEQLGDWHNAFLDIWNSVRASMRASFTLCSFYSTLIPPLRHSQKWVHRWIGVLLVG